MSIFKTIKFELLILALVTLSIFATFNLDLFFYSYFINVSEWVNGVFLKEFFSGIKFDNLYLLYLFSINLFKTLNNIKAKIAPATISVKKCALTITRLKATIDAKK